MVLIFPISANCSRLSFFWVLLLLFLQLLLFLLLLHCLGYTCSETDPEVVKSTNQYVTIENLRKYTNYTVWVLAYTKVGDGMKTKPFYCRTHEDGKWHSVQ